MCSLYHDKEQSEELPCVVKISDSEIIVEYEDEDVGTVQYHGKNNGTGHFMLAADAVKAKATLHTFPESTRLEGSWIEDGHKGMWYVDLA